MAGLCVGVDDANDAAVVGAVDAVPPRSVGDEAREVIGKLIELLRASGLTPSCVVQVSRLVSYYT